jgi:O-antigen/teichoic acid export membrane protein
VLRDSGWLVAGTSISGLAAYGYVILGTRELGAVAFAPISVLWTFWAMSAAVLTFPVMHWVIRTLEADGSEDRVRSGLPAVWIAALAVSTATFVVAWLGRNAFFQQESLLFPLMAGLIPFGSVAIGISRGALAGRQRFAAAGAAIAVENLIRMLLGGIVLAFGGKEAAFAWVLVVGFVAAVFWPSALRLRRDTGDRRHPLPIGFLGGIAGGSLIAQVVITGGPAVVAVLGGNPLDITGLFATLALFRAPYQVALGVTVRLTGGLTRLYVDGRQGSVSSLQRGGVVAAVLGAPLAGVFGAVSGPGLVRFVFGGEVIVSGTVAAAVSAGSWLALVSLCYTLMLIAGARTSLVTGAWVVGLVAGGAWSMLGPGDPVVRVAWAFCLAEAVTITTMVAAPRWSAPD